MAASLFGFTGSSSAQTADELVAENVAVRGGAAKLHAINTMTMTATISFFGPQASSPLTVHAMRPDKIREDLIIDGKPSMRAYDGKIGWQEEPGRGAEELTGGALENIRDEGENAIEGPLLDYTAKGRSSRLSR